VRRLAAILVALLVIAAGAAAALYHRATAPYRGFQTDEVFVELPAGTREGEIARRLADAGVVPDVWTFRLAARLSGADKRLQAGEYRFAGAASPREVVARLARGDVYKRGVTFPEGLTIREMAQIFEHGGLGAATDFEHAAANGGLVAPLDPQAPNLEGYLFPSTYALPRTAGAPETVHTMLAQFEKVFDAKLRAAAAAQQLTVRQAVTLASLIEKETARPDERPIVSAVYRNRLRLHMPLQCDPTVIYALMLAGTWNGNIRKDDLQIDSPYNTYRYPGLPPGPIASPGRTSLEAAVHPADVPYLYFVSRNDGTHVFASSLDEHNRNVARFQLRRH
jgi:peptidoglycan lytic transglycosylase G